MKKWVVAFAVFPGLITEILTAQSAPLTSLAAVHTLNNAQAAQHIQADFEATVTYYRDYEQTMFVQDGDVAIYIQPKTPSQLQPGDRIRIQGTTHESFRPFVMGEKITFIRHERLPDPIPSTFDEIIHARRDCQFVSLRGKVLSADIILSSDRRSIALSLLTSGGTAKVIVDSDAPNALPGLLDAEVQVTGAVSGLFDGKMQMTGVVIHAQTLEEVHLLRSADASPWALPVTPMDEIISAFREDNLSSRVRVHGIITYYMAGTAVVLQNGTRSLWVNTRTRADLKIGDYADATGFPDVYDGFLRLSEGEVQDSQVAAPLKPVSVSWRDLTASHHVFDLVSIEGQVVAQVREGGQDEYVLVSDGHLFSAIYRHPAAISLRSPPPLPPMKSIPPGSRVRITGVCILEDSNPFNADVPFDLLMRSFDDIAVVARPSWVTVGNLVKVVTLLLVVVLAVSGWGWTLRRKVHRQTTALATRIEAEAATERRNAQIEQRRSRILEEINGSRPLVEVLEDITGLVSFHLNGASCWCEISEGARLGRFPGNSGSFRVVLEEIPARAGQALGVLYAALDHRSEPLADERQALIVGARLATLAIETRRLYTDLVHRSEFDLLTDIHNRFSLDKELERLIAAARESAGIFGLIYVDLDEFKQVNDVYGHRVGDLYLQEVAIRMKRQLRAGDLLARLGGDEFAALVPTARTRADVKEIAVRLETCFDSPFHVEGYELRGSASIGIALYPEDGSTKDSLLSAADAAMYVTKHIRHETVDEEEADRTASRRDSFDD